MLHLAGIKIVSSALAVKRERRVEVVKHSLRKRRRNWTVRITWEEVPCAYRLSDGTMVVHPSTLEQLKRQAEQNDYRTFEPRRYGGAFPLG